MAGNSEAGSVVLCLGPLVSVCQIICTGFKVLNETCMFPGFRMSLAKQ